MRNSYFFYVLTLLFLSFSSCETADCDGCTSDTIKLSKNKVMFNSSENSETIKTEGANWWIASIIVDKNGIDLGDIDTTKKSFLIENDVFTFERQNGNEIFISVSENQTNEERIITFTLQSGNYHDGIRVVQSSN